MSISCRELGEIVEFRGGGTPSKSRPEFYKNGTIPWVTPKDMKYWDIETSMDLITEDAVNSSTARMVPISSVLIVIRSGVLKHTLPVGINSVPVTVNQDLKALVCSDLIDPVYLARFLKSSTRQILEKVKGTTADNISTKDLKTLSVPLPPLPEQKRIAGILDAADALRAKRRESLAQLDTLLQSTFLDMFGDPVTNPMGWEVVRLEDVSTRITKGASPKWQGFDYQDRGVLFVTSENVRQGFMDVSKPKYVPPEFHSKLGGSQLRTGDLLINLVGASIGRSCLFTQNQREANVNQAVGVVSLKEPLLATYLLQLLQTSQGKSFLTGKIVEAARANISLKNLRDLILPSPPLPLQQRFATIVESIEQQKARMRSHLEELDTLFASLQSRAFNGEL